MTRSAAAAIHARRVSFRGLSTPATVGAGVTGEFVRGSTLAGRSASSVPLSTTSATVHSPTSPDSTLPLAPNESSLATPTVSQNVVACIKYARAWSKSASCHMPLAGRAAVPGEYVDIRAGEVGVWVCIPGAEWNENDSKNVSMLSTSRLRAPGGSFGCGEGRRCTRSAFPGGAYTDADEGVSGRESRETFFGVEGMWTESELEDRENAPKIDRGRPTRGEEGGEEDVARVRTLDAAPPQLAFRNGREMVVTRIVFLRRALSEIFSGTKLISTSNGR